MSWNGRLSQKLYLLAFNAEPSAWLTTLPHGQKLRGTRLIHSGIAGVLPSVPLKKNLCFRWTEIWMRHFAVAVQDGQVNWVASRLPSWLWNWGITDLSAIIQMSCAQHLTCQSQWGPLPGGSVICSTNSLRFIDLKYGQAWGMKQVVGHECTLSWPSRGLGIISFFILVTWWVIFLLVQFLSRFSCPPQ